MSLVRPFIIPLCTIMFYWHLCNAIEPPLTLMGPRGLLAAPIRCTIGYLAYGRRLSFEKTSQSHDFSVMSELSQNLSNFISCYCSIRVYWYFEQSSLIYVPFLFLVLCYKTFFSILRFLTLFDTCAYRLDYCRSHYRIMFSVLKYLDISCCWM